MSFTSYYNATTELLSKNQTKATILESELNSALQLFYNWDYEPAVNAIASVYHSLDATPPEIIGIFQTPLHNSVLPEDEVKVNATVIDDLSGVRRVILNYTNHNGTWSTLDMSNIWGDVWNATIPAFTYGTNVTYTIIAEDNFNNKITSQEVGLECTYRVVPEFQSFLIPPLFIITTLLAVLMCKRKRP